jgi:uncharacterized membrane protein
MSYWTIGLLVLAALGGGLLGGVFFAFSAFVMRGLGRPQQGPLQQGILETRRAAEPP